MPAIEGFGTGTKGTPIYANFMVVGTDNSQVDTFAAKQVGIDPYRIKHIDVDEDVRIVGDYVDYINIQEPPSDGRVINRKTTFLFGDTTCTACASTMKNALGRERSNWRMYLPMLINNLLSKGGITIFSGKESLATEDTRHAIFLGQCTEDRYQCCHLNGRSEYIAGCPPAPDEVRVAYRNIAKRVLKDIIGLR
ncbi:MAG: hypothetical protein ABII01_04315 [Candidatus Woesearchaeota archaeon]